MGLLLACLLLLSPVALEAQKRPARKTSPAKTAPQQQVWPLESVAVEGNREFTDEQVLKAADVRAGQTLAAPDFEAARQRLIATGAFESIGFEYRPSPGGKGYALTFEVVEAAQLFPVRFEDLGIPDQQMMDALRRADPLFGAKVPGTDAYLARSATLIENILAAAGRKEKITGRVVSDRPGELLVLFRPGKGPPAVSRVRALGAQAVPTTAFEQAINAVAVGVPYREARFRELLETSVKPLYDARGRVRASFPEVTAEPDKDVTGVVVTVKVAEGESYSLGDVEIVGAHVPSPELLKAAGLKTEDVFNGEAVQAGLAAMEKRLRRDGYMQAKAEAARRIDDKTKQVRLTITVNEGPQYLFGKLTLEGLDILSEPAIRKMWALKRGQPFNADYPESFLRRIEEEGVFDNLGETMASLKTDEGTRTVDVVLVFRGAPAPKPKPIQ